MEGQIRLRWTSHQGTVLSIFDALLSNESYVDVTLACEGQYIRAHRIILSACSPYFQKLLDLDTSKHPIFFMKDIKFTELKALVQYMYRGEVNIPHADLESLLAVAQALQVRGLTEVDTSPNSSIGSETIVVAESARRPKQPTVEVPLPKQTRCSAPLTNSRTTRSIAQDATFQSSKADATTPSPPAAKKSRIDKAPVPLRQPNVQQAAEVDPLLPSGSSGSKQYKPTPPDQRTSSHRQGSFDAGFTLEESEAYEGQEQDVKIEAVTTTGIQDEMGLDDDNSVNQSDFSGNWQTLDDSNSDSQTDGSLRWLDSNTSNGTNITTTRPGRRLSQRVPNTRCSIFDGRFFEIVSSKREPESGRCRVVAKCLDCGSVFNSTRTSNIVRHLMMSHPQLYVLYKKNPPPEI